MKYDKTQFGTFLIIVFLSFLVLFTFLWYFQIGKHPLPVNIYLLLCGVMLLCLLLFYKLRVIVDHTSIKMIYGVGVIRIVIRPKKVNKVDVVRVPFYYGLGIRTTPTGLLYNIQGGAAVKVSYFNKSERQVLIGSSEPEKLKRVIEANFFSTVA